MSALGFCIFFKKIFYKKLQLAEIILAVFRDLIENSDVSEVLTENNTGFHLSTNL